MASSQFAEVDVSVRLASRAHVYLYFKCIRRQQHQQNRKEKKRNSSSSRRVSDPEQQGKQEKTATCMHVHIVGGHVCHLVAGTEARRVYKVQLSCVGSR